MTTSHIDLMDDLLGHQAWARRLAAQLLSGDEPADLLQETWAVAATRPTPSGVSGRKWLAGIMRNLARMSRRASARRGSRERSLGALVHGQTPSRPDELTERLEVQRSLAGLVLELAPIYRDVVLLRFYDDLASDEIAERLGINPSTARRRLMTALAQLRESLASTPQTGRDDWRKSLAVLVSIPTVRRTAAAPAAVATVALGTTLAIAFLVHLPPPSPGPAAARAAGPIAARAALGPPGLHTSWAAVAPVKAREGSASEPPSAAPGGGGDKLALAAPAQPERLQIAVGVSPLRGPANAKVTILEFVDYQCPFTARAQRDLDEVLAQHPQDVRFGVVHRPLPFHAQAGLLARAALAGNAQGRFWPLHARLMGRAREVWTVDKLLEEVRFVGLDPTRFAADLASATLKMQLASDQAVADQTGIDGVPLFFVNGRPLVGADAPAAMPSLIAEELALADRLIAAGADPAHIYDAVLANAPAASFASILPRAPSPRRPREGHEALFTKAGSCSPPLPEPAGLDLAAGPGDSGKWSLSASGVEQYRIETNRRGKSVTLRSVTAGTDQFAAYHQTVLAQPFIGKRLRFRAEARSEDRPVWAGIFLRVEGEGERIVTSQRTRLMPGDLGWHTAEVVVAVPAEGRALSYGLLLAGPGVASMRNLAVETLP